MIEYNEDYKLMVTPNPAYLGETVKIRLADQTGVWVEETDGNNLKSKDGVENAFVLKIDDKPATLDTPDVNIDSDGKITLYWKWMLDKEKVKPGGYFIDVFKNPDPVTRKLSKKQVLDIPQNGERIAGEKLEVRTPLGSIAGSSREMSSALTDLSEGISLKSTERPRVPDLPLWVTIQKSTTALSFDNYSRFMDLLLCNEEGGKYTTEINNLNRKRFLPFTDTDGYRTLKVATEAFIMVNCGVRWDNQEMDKADILEMLRQKNVNISSLGGSFEEYWNRYLVDSETGIPTSEADSENATIPYLYLIRRKLKDLPLKVNSIDGVLDRISESPNGQKDIDEANCFGVISQKLTFPCCIELIWSYWHEECMLVQGIKAISQRFQNIKSRRNDPLAAMEIGPLQPLNNLLWGFIQDERNRLTVQRRNHEYMHQYGFGLIGKAISRNQFADTRVQFLGAFHQLLYLCAQYYKQEDDATVQADAFPIRNALREVHLILSEGAHNQYGDLPSVARMENLVQQYIMARPEFRQFISGRTMVAYPEAWMDRVATLNKIMGWTDISPIHFSRLAIFGEQLLLSIRFGSWSDAATETQQAGVWANFWRQAIQEYIHAYQAVTGVDLAATRINNQKIDNRPPSYHLAKRLKTSRNGKVPTPKQKGAPMKKGAIDKEWF